MEQILLVDGYNVIGAWPELSFLKDRDLEAARDKLVEWMAEYQSYTGYRVVVVFDAQFVRGVKRKARNIKSKSFLRMRMKRQMSTSNKKRLNGKTCGRKLW